MRVGKSTAHGFTYVTVLVLVAVLSLGLAVAGPKWSEARQRDREQELLRIGQLYAQAIAAYYEASPGSLKQYPPALESLLIDTRFIGTRRHLRRLYTDPFAAGAPLQVVRGSDGTVRGVYSSSSQTPFRQAPILAERMEDIPPASQYQGWRFVARPRT